MSMKITLSEREKEVLSLLSEGLPVKDVSKIMNISGNTAKLYLANACRKLNAKNRVEAVVKALKHKAL